MSYILKVVKQGRHGFDAAMNTETDRTGAAQELWAESDIYVCIVNAVLRSFNS